ncbi:hypothetical protein J5N97_001483 [Dioscorea zingiberensis]|uniref:glutathione transferase n=1 Tax=Dioscorea zingiberensis TaxID=325984 RepID=A0A9D5BTP1_9LILI|nr:hypothetical protein J5N97_001483 [Dioscorea zingiberensis]
MIGIETDEMVVEESKKKLAKVLDIYEQRLQETSHFWPEISSLLRIFLTLPNAHRIVKSTECAKLFMSRKMHLQFMEGVVKVYYGKPMLPDVSRVLACLYEKEIKFNLIDMHEGHQMSPGFLNLQASTRAPVPGFEDSSTILFGNVSLDYDKFQLLLYLMLTAIVLGLIPESRAICRKNRCLSRMRRSWPKSLMCKEQRLGDSRFLAGNEFTLADLFHLPNSHYLANSEEWRHLFESRKNVRRWWKKISNRNSWRKVVEILKQEDALKKKQKEIKSLENQQTPVIRLSHLHRDSTSDQPTTTVTITKA